MGPDEPDAPPTDLRGKSPDPFRVPLAKVHHLRTLPVRLDDSLDTRFVLDTGIGVNLLSTSLASRLGVRFDDGRFTGRRMSGQEVAVRLGTVGSLHVGPFAFRDVTFGEFDLSRFPPELAEVGGFLSLGPLKSRPFTLAAGGREVRFGPAADLRGGEEVPLRLERDGPSVSAFVDLTIPSGVRVRAEVDTGSDLLILDRRYLAGLGVREDDPSVEQREGTDETGYRYVRLSARVAGELAVADAPSVRAPVGRAIFQSIVHEALVGDAFLGRYDVRFDLARERIRFARPRRSS